MKTINILVLVVSAPVLLFSTMGILFCDEGPISACLLASGSVALGPAVAIALTIASFNFIDKNRRAAKIMTLLASIAVIVFMLWFLPQLLPHCPSGLVESSENRCLPIEAKPTSADGATSANAPVVSNAPLLSSEQNESSTTATTHSFGIMTVTYGGNASVSKAVVALADTSSSSPVKLQSNATFVKGNQYMMYFSGVSGFTVNHPYGAPAGFVDAKAVINLYDANNDVVFSSPNYFASYVGGVPASDFAYITLKLTLDNDFKPGSYRWESVVTDNKNPSNYLKGVVNFTVNQ